MWEGFQRVKGKGKKNIISVIISKLKTNWFVQYIAKCMTAFLKFYKIIK